ncbi:MAG TPA: zinc ribbon domain-containing protein [Accumulibacter sp.]|uniref:FmdB family zinc ribbon protein n=1 Tax=Accumulibacter sp. TaxID=2053492 RepID=UPI0028783ADB|nr:FmdB family zinc ribbon protein [Accumulibacter sp.]MDS4054370.1 FmdB family zinc ribbon protein [Accumulibacter sp.]HMV03950.1 zinc ribbon domain-containing protein [Accumulibacter sp.]HMW80163.1 zinc ribbon domain-containing protein [Accumulibacter sp.]HMX69043.1 zinc ribbon domain-containing protein [Accumulibacter sp.]HNB67323.1 zinc ribbon domain-containing protein [Accumulibacter sp.]
MPIYAYRCSACGFEKDHLQKLNDPELRICPHCVQATYNKQVTAAGFQLKGSGWYVTDFKGGNKPPAAVTEKPEKVDTPAAESAGAAESGTCTAS